MKARRSGFTMIELIVVIVVLGILAATALPKFIDIGDEAKTASVKGMSAAMSSAMVMNYSGCTVKNNVVDNAKCYKVTSCTGAGIGVEQLLQGGALPQGVSVAASTTGGPFTTNGASFECAVSKDGKTVGFNAIAAGN